MLNKREREIVDRLDRVIKEMATLTPPNPADVRAVSTNLRIAVAASRELTRAIADLRCRDWEAADHHLTAAERAADPR